jgi:predicted Zn-dependent protease
MGHQLIKGRDGGGVRWFLDGKPVHAGEGLRLHGLEAGQTEVEVRFETSGGEAVVHADVAGHDFRAGVESWMRFSWLDGKPARPIKDLKVNGYLRASAVETGDAACTATVVWMQPWSRRFGTVEDVPADVRELRLSAGSAGTAFLLVEELKECGWKVQLPRHERGAYIIEATR